MFVVPVRRDGYVNVTKICQAVGKRLGKYFKTDHAKESMDFLQKVLDDEHAENIKLGKAMTPYGAIALLTSCKGGNINTVEQAPFAAQAPRVSVAPAPLVLVKCFYNVHYK